MDNKPHRKLKITQKGLDALRTDRDRPKEKTVVKLTKKGRDAIKDEVETEGFFGGKTKARVTRSIFNDPAFRKITGRKSLADIAKKKKEQETKKEAIDDPDWEKRGKKNVSAAERRREQDKRNKEYFATQKKPSVSRKKQKEDERNKEYFSKDRLAKAAVVRREELTPDQKKKREASRERTHGGTPAAARAIGVKTDHQQRGQKKTAKPHKYGSGVDAAGGQHTSVGRYGDKARPGRISKMAYAKKKEEVEMDETGRAASAASDPRVDTGSSSVDTVPGYEKKFIKTQKRVGRIPEEHDCEKVHPNLTHKDWEAEKNEAADTWHPDPVKDKKSTSYKHHARQMATQAMKKATKPDTFGHLKITPALLAARRRVRATEETINEAEWEVKLKGLPAFYIPAKSAGAVKQMLRKQLKRPMDDIESVTRATPAAKKKDFRQRAQGKPSAEEDRG